MNLDDALARLRGKKGSLSDWNETRFKGEEIPSLEKADLAGANLAGAHLESQETEIVGDVSVCV